MFSLLFTPTYVEAWNIYQKLGILFLLILYEADFWFVRLFFWTGRQHCLCMKSISQKGAGFAFDSTYLYQNGTLRPNIWIVVVKLLKCLYNWLFWWCLFLRSHPKTVTSKDKVLGLAIPYQTTLKDQKLEVEKLFKFIWWLFLVSSPRSHPLRVTFKDKVLGFDKSYLITPWNCDL